jgi:hypothetical protein
MGEQGGAAEGSFSRTLEILVSPSPFTIHLHLYKMKSDTALFNKNINAKISLCIIEQYDVKVSVSVHS